MTVINRVRSLVCLLCSLVIALAPWSDSTADETRSLASDRQIKPNERVELAFDLKAIPAGQQVRLFLDARIEWGNLGGNTPAMGVTVNDRTAVGQTLLNKPLAFVMRDGGELKWAPEDGADYRLMYSPDFSDRVKTDVNYPYGLIDPDQDPFHFVWDITALVRSGPNSLKIANSSGMSFALKVREVGIAVGAPWPRTISFERI
jgi:hypothetical protein